MRGCGKRREKRRRERENKRNDEEWREKEILSGTLFSVALLSAENPFLTGSSRSLSLSFSILSLMRGVHVATSCGRIAGAQNRPRVYRWAVQRTFGVCTCIKYRALPGYSLARVINPPRRVVAQSFRLGGVAPRQRTQRTLSESKFIAT